MVFNAEGLALRCSADRSARVLVRGFENGGHHFPAAESVLPAVDESPVDVSSSPRYHYFCISAHVASIYAIAALPLWRTARANNAAPTGIML